MFNITVLERGEPVNLVEPIRDSDDIDAMCDYMKKWNDRNHLLFLVGINTGLRISDIVMLKVSNFKGWYIVLRERKTRKEKRVKMNAALKREIEKYIADHELEKHHYLFQSRKGKNQPITRQQAYRILQSAAIDCGIENLGTHTLRKTFGYHYYQKHKDVAMLMNIFNHSTPAITKRYIGITQDQQDRTMANFKLGF